MIILSLLQGLCSRPPYTHTHYRAYQIATVLLCRESLMCLVDATAWVKHNQIERGVFMLASTALLHKLIAQKTSGKKLPIHQPKFTSSILHTPNSPTPATIQQFSPQLCKSAQLGNLPRSRYVHSHEPTSYLRWRPLWEHPGPVERRSNIQVYGLLRRKFGMDKDWIRFGWIQGLWWCIKKGMVIYNIYFIINIYIYMKISDS